tara:strand:+ start:2381 stop:4696 length:2316 start_codon:yes stop_codon:yes gene_type:complete
MPSDSDRTTRSRVAASHHPLTFITVAAALFAALLIMVKGFAGLFSATVIIGSTLTMFYGCRLVFRNAIVSIFSILLLVTSLSLGPHELHVPLSIFVVISNLIVIAVKRQAWQGLLASDCQQLQRLHRLDIVTGFVILFLSLFLGQSSPTGFESEDVLHPITPIALGHSYSLSLFTAPDLSYAGKEMRYTFLFEQVPQYLSNVLGRSVLTVASFELIFSLTVLSFLLLCAFARKHSPTPTPLLIIFFFPVYLSRFTNPEILYSRTVAFTGSYFAATILIVCAITFLIEKRFTLLYLAATALLLIKSLYFVTLMGGVFLYLIRKQEFTKLLLFFGAIIPTFGGMLYLFLSGAGSDAHWMLFPQFIYERAPGIFFGTFEYDRLRWICAWAPLMMLYSASVVYLSKTSTDNCLALSSVALSGFLGMLLVTEPTSLSARFFYLAATIPMTLTFYHWLHEHYLRSLSTTVLSSLPIVLYAMWLFALILDLFNIPRQDTLINLFVMAGILGVYGLHRMNINARPVVWYSVCAIAVLTLGNQITQNALLAKTSQHLVYGANTEDHDPSIRRYSNHLIEGYSWLNENTSVDSVILFGNHYEERATGFIRSALSGRQMYCEMSKYRGLGMQDDYAFRYASSIYFYSAFVQPSHISAPLLARIQDENFVFGGSVYFSDAMSREQHHTLKGKAVYYLSGGRDWSWINIPAKLDRKIKQQWIDYEQMNSNQQQVWGRNFLDSENISHIVLENGDQPSQFLQTLAQTVFTNDEITILRIQKSNLP